MITTKKMPSRADMTLLRKTLQEKKENMRRLKTTTKKTTGKNNILTLDLVIELYNSNTKRCE